MTRRIAAALVLAASLFVAACHSPSSPTSTAAAALSVISLSATTSASGQTLTATITLTAAAPTDGAVVSVSSSTADATVPATVTVPGGSTSQTFDIQTAPTTVPETVTITATYGDTTRTVSFTLTKLAIQSLTLSSPSIVAGGTAFATVALSAPAPPGGVQLTVASDNPLARVPGIVNIAAGDTSQVFGIATSDSSSPTIASVTVTLPYSGSSKTTTLTIGRVVIDSLSFGLTAIPGGSPVSGTVILSVVAPADLTIQLSSTSPVAVVPPTVVIPAGATSQSFDITTTNTPPTRTVSITASSGTSTKTAPLTVIAFPTVTRLTCTSTSPKAGTSVTCTGTLDAPAPGGGWQLVIMSSDDNVAGAVPSSIAVPASSSTFQFDVLTAPATTTVSAVISVVDAASALTLYTQAFTLTP